MQLNSVTVINSLGATLSLPLEDNSLGFSVKGIDGLDPVAATLVSSSFANLDGEQYRTSRRVTRNIKLSLGLDPDYGSESVKTLRDKLYRFFMPKSDVTLKFTMFDQFTTIPEGQTKDVYIEGRVETFDAPLFTDDPGADISIICYQPDFHDLTSIVFNGLTTDAAVQETINYEGSVDTGLLLTLPVTVDGSGFVLTSTLANEDVPSQVLSFAYPLLAGDVVEISTVLGSKSVRLTRGGVTTSALYGLSPDSAWVQLRPGNNNIAVIFDGDPMVYTIEYLTKYGGL